MLSHKCNKSKLIKANIDNALLREDEPCLPELSELEVVRHYTDLSQKNYWIDTQFYPLGSCTMKYNPNAATIFSATLSNFLHLHPLTA